jgi:hypothetical protein
VECNDSYDGDLPPASDLQHASEGRYILTSLFDIAYIGTINDIKTSTVNREEMPAFAVCGYDIFAEYESVFGSYVKEERK